MEIDEDVKAFLVDSNENLSQLEGDLVALEKSSDDPELMNRIYRSLHTLKGNCGFLGLDILESVAHSGENLLSRLRDHELRLTTDIMNGLLEVVDAIGEILENIENTGEESDQDYSTLINRLLSLQNQSIPDSKSLEEELETQEIQQEVTPKIIIETVENINKENETSLEENLTNNIETPETKEKTQITTNDISAPHSNITDTSIRVDVKLLDNLMNLVGELVLCRNQILEFTNQEEDSTIVDTSQRLNIVTSELQEGVMKTRMQPIKTIWNKFPRVVRDLSLALGKEVSLEMEGEDTELDKTLIEAITDPLTHIVRNSVDHGFEKANVRIQKGKPVKGKLLLKAFHESGYVNIEIIDDGKGIDFTKIKAKAIEKGLINQEKAISLSPKDIVNLIFLPGLSTADTVTNVSGRGVGMDVVRTNIERISGTIDVQSKIDEGTTFKLKIPLTLAIIPTLIVTTGGDRYAIPQVSLLELVRLEGKEAKEGVEMVHGAPVHRLRGKLLPLVYLNEELKIKDNEQRYYLAKPWQETLENNQSIEENNNKDILNIVVLQATNKSFGLVVDNINDSQEIVVKPLGKQLKNISCFAGSTIMGDGRVALILDIQGLAQKAHILSQEKDSNLTQEFKDIQLETENTQKLLLFTGSDQRRMAVSLSKVARLEKFLTKLIERIGDQKVIQYREKILPLIYLNKILGGIGYSNSNDKLITEVVVINLEDNNIVGLVVENIIDIVDQKIEVTGGVTDNLIQYAAVIDGQVTELLDIESIIDSANLKFYSKAINI